MSEPDFPPDLQAREMLRVLSEHAVEFAVIGGAAAILLGVGVTTRDLDVVPRQDADNLTRLTSALLAMEAEVRFGGGKVHQHPDGEWLRSARTWNFSTNLGLLDVLSAPAGVDDAETLLAAAEGVSLTADLTVFVASLDHLIAMKEAAGRTKDELALPMLRWLRDRPAEEP